MAKCKKFGEGTIVEGPTKDFESEYSRPKAKKPLPADNLKKDDKPPVEKYIKEPFRKANDKVSGALESVGLTNPIDVFDEELGGETVAEARARRAGMPVGKGVSKKSGGSVRSSASKRADGCAIRGKTRA